MMKLKELGWSSHFNKEFKPFKAQGLIPARVFSEQRKSYGLYAKKGPLRANARGILWHRDVTGTQVPVVGDWVAVEQLPEKNNVLIKSVLKRKNSFSRRTAGGRKRSSGGEIEEQIIAANIDLAFIVIGLDRDFNLRRIERYMTLVRSSLAKPVILLNKADLCQQKRKRKNEVQKLFPDTPVQTLVAHSRRQVAFLKKYIDPGQTAAVIGSSGVGKSTIINTLLGYEKQSVKEISEKGGKGQHTTSHRELIILPEGGIIMDNPGMRELQLWADEEDLIDTFTDIEDHAGHCRFRNCRHQKEPGCAVRKAVAAGAIDEKRYLNFLKLRSELNELQLRKKRG